jgi:hypothetical protein
MKKRGFERDLGYIESDSSWQKFLEDQPIIPPEIEKYDHIKLNTGDESDSVLQKATDYILK